MKELIEAFSALLKDYPTIKGWDANKQAIYNRAQQALVNHKEVRLYSEEEISEQIKNLKIVIDCVQPKEQPIVSSVTKCRICHGDKQVKLQNRQGESYYEDCAFCQGTGKEVLRSIVDNTEVERMADNVPLKIWANIYNPIKTGSWDLYNSENGAVKNSIGAKTHCYIHESIAHQQKDASKLEELKDWIRGETWGYTTDKLKPYLLTKIDSLLNK